MRRVCLACPMANLAEVKESDRLATQVAEGAEDLQCFLLTLFGPFRIATLQTGQGQR